jgi:hypothetical protein
VNVTEIGIVATLSYFIWHHPIASLVLALVLLIATMLLVRLVWRTMRQLLRRLVPTSVRDSTPA